MLNGNDINRKDKIILMNETKSEYKDKGLTGLVNLGNTCFMNACLQCLSHTYPFNDLLKKGDYKTKINKKAESLILMEWDKLRELMWSENCIISPGGFFTSVHKVAKIKDKIIFTGHAQNDLTEFLIFIINCFHSAIEREVNMKIKGDVHTETDKLAKSCFNMMKLMYKKEYSELLQLFFGIHVSKLETQLGELINSVPEPFLLLDLALPEKCDNGTTLRECLDQYTQIELLDENNKWTNEDTGKKELIQKQILFWSLPDVFIISLKRFSNSLKKNGCLVDFPLENLDMSQYIVGYDKHTYVYDLYGVCNHTGGVYGGHYSAFIKNANGKWYHFDDTNVGEVKDCSKIKSPKAYCFFYCKKKIR